MSRRQRQFSAVRSRANSQCHSETSQRPSFNQISGFSQKSFNQTHDCVNCINKKLTLVRKDEQKRKNDEQMKKHLENIKRLGQIPDYQKQSRERMALEASRYNRSLVQSQRQSQKHLKKLQAEQEIKQIAVKQKLMAQQQQDYIRQRKQLESKYHEQLRNQLKLDRSTKQLEISRCRTQNPQQVNNLKVLAENEKWVQKMAEERKKCMKENRKQLTEKKFAKFQQRQRQKIEQKRHLQRVDLEFSRFTENQPAKQSPYYKSRSILSFQDNPENIFTQMKRTQTQRTFKKINQRQNNYKERMQDLKKQEQQQRLAMQQKLFSMKSYVEQLTQQLHEKRRIQEEQTRFRKFYQPEKSRVDYFTEELGKEKDQCHTCEKIVQRKYFGA